MFDYLPTVVETLTLSCAKYGKVTEARRIMWDTVG